MAGVSGLLSALAGGAVALPVAVAGLAAAPVWAAVPPADANGLTRERLACGLEVWVCPAPGTGEVAAALVIRSGSLDESDDQRGAAYVAKRAAGFGTEHASVERLSGFRVRPGYPDERVDPRDGYHAYVTHSGVVYRMVFDAGAGDPAWDAALGHARDLISGWSPEDGVLDAAIVATLEREPFDKPESIARRRFLTEVFEGERLGERPIVPDEDVLRSLTHDAVRAFVRERYTPGAAALVITGDFDAGEVLTRVRRAMDGVRAVPAKPPVGAIARRAVGGRISAHVIEGYPGPEASLIAVRSAPVSGALTEGVLDRVAAELVEARVRRAVLLADPDAGATEVGITDAVRGVRIAEVSVKAEPAAFEAVAQAAAEELARIQAHGFARDEYLAARAAALSLYEERARGWKPGDLGALFNSLVFSVATRRDWADPAAELEHAARTLARTTDDMLLARVKEGFDPRSMNCVLLAPEATPGVAESAGRGLIDRARHARVDAVAPVVPEALGQPGTPAPIVEVSHDAGTGVWTGTLGNGVVVRAKSMPAADRATVRVGFSAGVIDEDGRTAGRTRDALAAWAYPRVGEHGAAAVRAWAAQRGLTFKAEIDQHRASLEVEGPRGSEADALALAGWLIGSAGVDGGYMDRVRPEDPEGTPVLDALGAMMLAPGDPRAGQAPPSEQVRASDASAWLAGVCAAPIEVSVVGPVDPPAVLERAGATLGVLPMRHTPDNAWRERWGALPTIETTVRVAGEGDGGAYALGVVFGDANDLDVVRPVVIGTRAIDEYLLELAEQGEMPSGADAFIWLGDGIPGRAAMIAWIHAADGASPDGAGATLEQAIGAFLEDPSLKERTDAMIQQAIDRAVGSVDGAMERPGFWSRRLSSMSAFGLEIDALAGMSEAYRAITVEDVRAALKRAMNTGVHKRVVLTPGEATR